MSFHITDAEFLKFQSFVYQSAGISMHAGKKSLICARLGKRLQYHQLHSYGTYFDFIQSEQGAAERQMCIDLLTTNETYFFREPRHFEWLASRCVHCPRVKSRCASGALPAPAVKRCTAWR